MAIAAGRRRIRLVRHRKHGGVTLLELCFGLALVAVLAALAVPGFRASLRAAAVRSAAFELMAGIQQARADSIVESRIGLWCAADTAGACHGADVPSRAWRVALEAAPARDAQVHALPRGVVLRASRPALRFWPHAHAASTGTLTICDEARVAAPRAIVISQSGRARFAAATSADCA